MSAFKRNSVVLEGNKKRIVLSLILLTGSLVLGGCDEEAEPLEEEFTFEELSDRADLAAFVKLPENRNDRALQVERIVFGSALTGEIELAEIPKELERGGSYLLFLEEGTGRHTYELMSSSGIVEYNPNKAVYETDLLSGDGEYGTHELADLIARERAGQ